MSFFPDNRMELQQRQNTSSKIETHGFIRKNRRSSQASNILYPVTTIMVLVALICLVFQAQTVYGHGEINKWRSGMPLPVSNYNPIAATNLRFEHGRALLATTTTSTTYRPLAERNDRVDPLNKLHKYTGGYDLKNKHYWASLIFTGIYGYAIAVAWLALGLLLGLFVCCKCMCGRKPHSKRPRSAAYYWFPRVIVLFLSAVAIGASVVLYIASRDFNKQAYNVEDVLLAAANNATASIHNVSATLTSVETTVRPYSSSLADTLNSTNAKLDSEASVVQDKVLVNKQTYKKVFKIVHIVLLVTTSLTLLFVVLGFASTFMRWRRIFYLIIILAWILSALTWAMFGLFFTIHNLASDTCIAADEYLQNPKNTTLDALLPCADLATAESQYLQVRMGMKNVIANASAEFLRYTNGSTDLTGLCDPIGPAPDYTFTNGCPNTYLPIGDLPSIIQPFVCNSTQSACLANNQTINQTYFTEISDMCKAGQSVLDTFPVIQSLTNCSFVTNTLAIIVKERCGPAMSSIHRIWISFALLSSVMIFLIVFWILANRRNSEQRYLATVIPQDQAIYSRPYNVMDK